MPSLPYALGAPSRTADRPLTVATRHVSLDGFDGPGQSSYGNPPARHDGDGQRLTRRDRAVGLL